MSAGVKMDDNRVHETLRHELTTSESAPTGTAPVTSRTRHRRSGQTYRRNRAQRATLATRATTAKAQEQSASGGTPLSLVGTSGGALGGCAETRRFRPWLCGRVLDTGPRRAPDLGAVWHPLPPEWRVVPLAAHGLELPTTPTASTTARRCSHCALEALRLAADKKSGVS